MLSFACGSSPSAQPTMGSEGGAGAAIAGAGGLGQAGAAPNAAGMTDEPSAAAGSAGSAPSDPVDMLEPSLAGSAGTAADSAGRAGSVDEPSGGSSGGAVGGTSGSGGYAGLGGGAGNTTMAGASGASPSWGPHDSSGVEGNGCADNYSVPGTGNATASPLKATVLIRWTFKGLCIQGTTFDFKVENRQVSCDVSYSALLHALCDGSGLGSTLITRFDFASGDQVSLQAVYYPLYPAYYPGQIRGVSSFRLHSLPVSDGMTTVLEVEFVGAPNGDQPATIKINEPYPTLPEELPSE